MVMLCKFGMENHNTYFLFGEKIIKPILDKLFSLGSDANITVTS